MIHDLRNSHDSQASLGPNKGYRHPLSIQHPETLDLTRASCFNKTPFTSTPLQFLHLTGLWQSCLAHEPEPFCAATTARFIKPFRLPAQINHLWRSLAWFNQIKSVHLISYKQFNPLVTNMNFFQSRYILQTSRSKRSTSRTLHHRTLRTGPKRHGKRNQSHDHP